MVPKIFNLSKNQERIGSDTNKNNLNKTRPGDEKREVKETTKAE